MSSSRSINLSWIFGVVLSLLAPIVAFSQSPEAPLNKTTATLVSEVKSIAPGKAFDVAICLKMPPGWHTYWKYPGDSGAPTRVTWELPEGFKAHEIDWPVPEKIEAGGLITYGYHGEVYLLSTIHPSWEIKAGTKVEIKAKVEWVECEQTCVPGEATVSLTLPVVKKEPAVDSAYGPKINASRLKLPEDPLPDQFTSRREGDEWVLQIRRSLAEGETVTFIPEVADLIVLDAPQVLTKVDSKYELRIKISPQIASEIKEVQGIVKFANDSWSVKFPVQAPVVLHPPRVTSEPMNLFVALMLSFIGGLILNLMPCVLPVLSLKVLGFVQDAGGDSKRAWHHGLAFTSGVMVAFWSLAGLLLILRAGGEQLGWGFQLQSPIFVAVLCGVLTLIGLNLFGLFEVGVGLVSLQGAVSGSRGLVSSFASGVLATAVATPCTAPFMGTALGFALSQTALTSMIIFTALGLGMAMPYLILSARVEWLRWLPKPGLWMVTFKQLMGFPMLATVVWLLWVLGRQSGIDAVMALLMGLVLLSLGVWVISKSKTKIMLVMGFSLVLIGWGGGIWVVKTHGEVKKSGATLLSGSWEPYDPGRLASLRATGTPVFIDFTAAWCLTCQVNEKVVLSQPEVMATFDSKGIVKMKADWTSRNPEITQALASYGRSGVPVYVLYGKIPGAEPEILPEILSVSEVVAAINRMVP